MQINKEYEQPFALEPTKLTRLMEKIHERITENSSEKVEDHFEVFFSENRQDRLSSLDEVLALDNSRKQKIHRLLIVSSINLKATKAPTRRVEVDFGQKKAKTKKGNNAKIIEVRIFSDESGWASRMLSEIEEQLERTWLRYLTAQLLLVLFLLCITLVFASQFISIRAESSRTMWLGNDDLDYVESILTPNHIVTDQEMREVFTRQLRTVLDDQRPKPSPQNNHKAKLILLGIPFAILLVCTIVILACYPYDVFLWGDEVERFNFKAQVRKWAGGIIISVLITGVAANLASTELIAIVAPK